MGWGGVGIGDGRVGPGQGRKPRQGPAEVSDPASFMSCCLTFLYPGGSGQAVGTETIWALCRNGEGIDAGNCCCFPDGGRSGIGEDPRSSSRELVEAKNEI